MKQPETTTETETKQAKGERKKERIVNVKLKSEAFVYV